jgi:hypothetical protein
MPPPVPHPTLRSPLSAWWAPLVLLALAAAQSVAQAPREVLNSERIAAKFGSYGVQVLSQDDRLRVSNLFSGDADHRICRTFALVRYAPRIDPVLAAPHAAIVAGGSIGAVFTAEGWEVRKTHLHYGETPASARLAELMDIDAGTPLAEHVYVLDVAKEGRVIEYAALVEIHHPDYLRLGDLEDIYGPPDPGDRRDLVAELLATAADRSR